MSLYNCKCDGDQYRISKFTNDLDVEASYLTDGAECDCPAGHRPVCRHRIMLVRFIAKNATAGQWFHNYEHDQWIRAASDDEPYTSTTLGELMISDDLASAASELTTTQIDERIRECQGPMPGDGLIGAMVDSTMKTINLLELAKPTDGPYGISPMITHDLPIIKAHNEATHERLVKTEQSRLELGGFPWNCYDQGKCESATDCIVNGCAKGRGRPPRQSIEPKPLRML